jgi:hypothetical protein
MLNQRIMKALRIIHDTLKDTRINWTLGGSINLLLQGVDVAPRDIDIVTDKQGAISIGELLKNYEIKKVRYVETEKIASYLGKFEIEQVEVEVIGEPRIKTTNGGWAQFFVPKHRQIRNLEGMRIPLILLEDELKAYERLGRKDKVQKIKWALRRE